MDFWTGFEKQASARSEGLSVAVDKRKLGAFINAIKQAVPATKRPPKNLLK